MAVSACVVRCEDPAEAYRLISPSPSPPPPPYSLCNAFSPKARAPRRLFNTGPCNFSVSDFLSAVSLLRDLIDALQESGGASREHAELIAELRRLEAAILQVDAHYGNIESPAQQMVLDQAAQACQKSVNDFLSSVRERQHDVSSYCVEHRGSDTFPEIQWNLVTTEDIVTFRCCISAHVQSIQTLLITIQVSSTEIARRHENSRLGCNTQLGLINNTNHSLVLINDSFDTLRQALVDQGSISQQTLANVDAVKQIMIMNNVQLLSALKKLQDSLPPQVLLQKPVIFTDALDRVAPIHLDWISSWDAFIAVLELRFTRRGSSKIKRREFALQESATRKDLPFTRPIDVCLTPGQHVDMSMIFQDRTGERSTNTCPHCHASCKGSTDSETTCMQCGCQFRRIQQQDDQSEAIRDAMSIEAIVAQVAAEMPKKRKRPVDQIPYDEVGPSDFKRLRLMWSRPSRKKRRVGNLQDLEQQDRILQETGFGMSQVPQEQAQILDAADPYAPYGGYQNYVARWYAAQQQEQPADGYRVSVDPETHQDHISDSSSAPLPPQGSPDEDWRRRTWHPSPYSPSGFNYDQPAELNWPQILYSPTGPGYDQPATTLGDSSVDYRSPFPAQSLWTISTSDSRGSESTFWSSNSGLHGEQPLNQENLSRSALKYDDSLLSKIGKASDNARPHGYESTMNGDTTTDHIYERKIGDRWSQRSPISIPNDHYVEAPPPLPSPRYIDELAEGHDKDWQLQDFDERFGRHRALAPIMPSKRPPVGNDQESHVLRREMFDDLLISSSQPHIRPPFGSSLFGDFSYEPNDQAPTSPAGSVMSYQSYPPNAALHQDTNESTKDHQNMWPTPSSLYTTDRSSDSTDFVPGLSESILRRIETPALNSVSGWSTPYLPDGVHGNNRGLSTGSSVAGSSTHEEDMKIDRRDSLALNVNLTEELDQLRSL